MTKGQQGWTAIERATCDVSWTLKSFEKWIIGSSVELISDHNPLTFNTNIILRSSNQQNSCKNERYDSTFYHCSFEKLKTADALSTLKFTIRKETL